MKKLLSVLLIVVMVFSAAIALTACGGGKIFEGTLESNELYFGNSSLDRNIVSNEGQTSLRGPAYYDYSEMKLLVNGEEVEGFFTLGEIDYNSNYVYIGTINPKKLTSDSAITVTGIKDRYTRFTFMDFKDTQEYSNIKERYEGYLESYTVNSANANDLSLSEEERNSARREAESAKYHLDNEFDGITTGFNNWYASKMAFEKSYSLKLSEKDKAALSTSPLKDKVIDGTSTTYGSLISEDGYISLDKLSKIKNNGGLAYQFEYTYKELTVWSEYGFTMGMLPIKSNYPLGMDTAATRNSFGSGTNKTLHFNRVGIVDFDEYGNSIYGKNSEYDRDSVLSVDVYWSNNATLDDDYANKLYLRMYDLGKNVTYAIDPTLVEYSEFEIKVSNRDFNGIATLEIEGFTVKNMGNQTYTMDQLGSLYIYTDQNNNSWVQTGKLITYRITAEPGEVDYHMGGAILFDGDNAKMDVDWDSYIYYDYNSHMCTTRSIADDDSDPSIVQVKRSMVEDITDNINVLVTADDINCYYQVPTSAGESEKFSASNSTYSFDMILDSNHNIDWTNVKVNIGGVVFNKPVNMVELKDDYGSYEIREYVVNGVYGLQNTKVLHCTINLYKGGSISNVASEEDVYYPIHFVNKEDLIKDGSRDAYTTYYIQVEGADFSEATGIVKVKGTSNVNPDAFEFYDNGSAATYKNEDGSAYIAVNDAEIMGTNITGPHFVVRGQNFSSSLSATNGPEMFYVSAISSMTIGVKKDGSDLKNINVKNYLTDLYRYSSSDPIGMMYGGNGGYYFAETEGDYKFHVFVQVEETFDGQINSSVGYISAVVIVVEDTAGVNPSENLQGFFEFSVDMAK